MSHAAYESQIGNVLSRWYVCVSPSVLGIEYVWLRRSYVNSTHNRNSQIQSHQFPRVCHSIIFYCGEWRNNNSPCTVVYTIDKRETTMKPHKFFHTFFSVRSFERKKKQQQNILEIHTFSCVTYETMVVLTAETISQNCIELVHSIQYLHIDEYVAYVATVTSKRFSSDSDRMLIFSDVFSDRADSRLDATDIKNTRNRKIGKIEGEREKETEREREKGKNKQKSRFKYWTHNRLTYVRSVYL